MERVKADRLHKQGLAQAAEVGKEAVIARVHMIDDAMDKPKANGFIETYTRLIGECGYIGLGWLTFYDRYCVPPVKMNPPMSTLPVRGA